MRKVIKVEQSAGQHWVGDGFPVRTLLSHQSGDSASSPFLMLDYAGPHNFAPKHGQPRGVGAHPHKGFETVTIVYEGEVEHRDSTGAGGVIGPGDVQWMTAGRGILHQEYHSPAFTATGGAFEMAQLWVNLPAANKSAAPRYQSITKDMIPTVREAGYSLRVIAGRHTSQMGEMTEGPTATFTELNVWDLRANPEAEVSLRLPESHLATLILLEGAIEIDGVTYQGPQSLTLSASAAPVVFSSRTVAKILVLSGAPIEEPVIMYGPFVMNTSAEIREAVKDFNSGRFGQI